jgi:hypothetical protein
MVQLTADTFLFLKLVEGKWLALQTAVFPSRERHLGIGQRGGLLGSRTIPDVVVKRKPCFYWESNSSH